MRKLFKHIGMICLALAVAVGSFFVPMRKPNKSFMASADSVVTQFTFEGSNVYVPLYRDEPSGYYLMDYLLYKNTFYYYDNGIQFDLSGSMAFVFAPNNTDISQYNYQFCEVATSYDVDNASYSSSFYYSFDDVGQWVGRQLSYIWYTGKPLKTASLWVYCSSSDFTADIYCVEFSSDNYSINGVSNNYNTITYYDVNNNYIRIAFLFLGSVQDNLVFTPRTYYLDNEITESDVYNQGYNAGLQASQSNFYDSGYETGYIDGFDNGKIIGAADANDYSFFSLFGAIFDAPITMLMGLLNFEFLGINLWAFVTSLLTLAIILFVIKLIIGR